MFLHTFLSGPRAGESDSSKIWSNGRTSTSRFFFWESLEYKHKDSTEINKMISKYFVTKN